MQNKPPPAAIKALPGASKCRNAFTSRGKPEVMIAKAETTSANNKLNAMMNTVNKMIATTNRIGKASGKAHNPMSTIQKLRNALFFFFVPVSSSRIIVMLQANCENVAYKLRKLKV